MHVDVQIKAGKNLEIESCPRRIEGVFRKAVVGIENADACRGVDRRP